MKPTKIKELAAIFVVMAVGVRLMASLLYPRLPPFHWTAPVSLALFGAVEAYTAATTQARLDGRPGTRPILPVVVARYAALAKASSLAAVLVGGFWAGLFAFAVTHRDNFTTASHDATVTGVGLASCVLLAVAALYLERVCRARRPPEQPHDMA